MAPEWEGGGRKTLGNRHFQKQGEYYLHSKHALTLTNTDNNAIPSIPKAPGAGLWGTGGERGARHAQSIDLVLLLALQSFSLEQ